MVTPWPYWSGTVGQGRSLWPGVAVVAAAGVMGHGYCTALRTCPAPLTDCRAAASSSETTPVTDSFLAGLESTYGGADLRAEDAVDRPPA